jgi:hypothetical protein
MQVLATNLILSLTIGTAMQDLLVILVTILLFVLRLTLAPQRTTKQFNLSRRWWQYEIDISLRLVFDYQKDFNSAVEKGFK